MVFFYAEERNWLLNGFKETGQLNYVTFVDKWNEYIRTMQKSGHKHAVRYHLPFSYSLFYQFALISQARCQENGHRVCGKTRIRYDVKNCISTFILFVTVLHFMSAPHLLISQDTTKFILSQNVRNNGKVFVDRKRVKKEKGRSFKVHQITEVMTQTLELSYSPFDLPVGKHIMIWLWPLQTSNSKKKLFA